MTEEEKNEKLQFLNKLDKEVGDFYWKLFALDTGGKFHAFVEWCGYQLSQASKEA